MKNIQLLILLILFNSCKEKIKTPNMDQTPILKKEMIANHKLETQKTIDIDKDFILGKYDYKKDAEFEKLKPIHSSKTIYLNKKVYTAFVNMYNAAKTDNINLKVISGTRNFYEQKSIWERKWEKHKNLKPIVRAKKILEFSSMPTTSRHHWGTDIDLNNLNNSYFEKGKGKSEYQWLVTNANKYGFYQVYTSKENGRTGYNMEKWHWSYLPLASKYLSFYNKNIKHKDIIGFKGAELAQETKMILEYVNGIAIKVKNYKGSISKN